jgi:hypothetical protein
VHQDCPEEGLKVKLFVYLNGADRTSGAHRFFPASKRRSLDAVAAWLAGGTRSERETAFCGKRYPNDVLERALCGGATRTGATGTGATGTGATGTGATGTGEAGTGGGGTGGDAGRITSNGVLGDGPLGCERWVEGPPGTVFMEDTHNFHAGSPVRGAEPRFVLQLEFVAGAKQRSAFRGRNAGWGWGSFYFDGAVRPPASRHAEVRRALRERPRLLRQMRIFFDEGCHEE